MTVEETKNDSGISAEAAILLRKAKTRKVKTADLVRQGNLRDSSNYDVPSLVESMIRNGFDPSFPPLVSERVVGEKTVLIVLRGNQRTEAAQKAGIETIPALVLSGLTAREETILRADFSSDFDRTKANEATLFATVRALVANGITNQSELAAACGQWTVKKDKTTGKDVKTASRSWAQSRVYLAVMPDYIIDEAMKRFRGEETEFRFNSANMLTLKQAKELDEKNGILSGDGPELRAAFDKLCEVPDPSVVKKLKNFDSVKAGFDANKNEDVRAVLMWVMDHKQAENLSDINARLDVLSADAALLRRILKSHPKIVETLPPG